jgi:hypothetical protein
MVYRVGEFRDLCTQCNETSSGRCGRCGDPLCGVHTPTADDVRCFTCEAFYLGRETNFVKTVVVAIVAVGAILGVAGAIGVHLARNGFITGAAAHMTPLLLFGAVGLFAAGFGMAPVFRSSVRRRFLRERPRPTRRQTQT